MSEDEAQSEWSVEELQDSVTHIEDSVDTLLDVLTFGILCIMGILIGCLIAWLVFHGVTK